MQIDEIIFDISRGMDKEDVAKKYGYSQFINLNTVMNRKGYRWNKEKQNFVKTPNVVNKHSIVSVQPRGKVFEVIKRLEKEKDARKIAKELGFKSHREMANYMSEKGYSWDSAKQNYIQEAYIVEQAEEIPASTNYQVQTTAISNTTIEGSMELSDEFKEILQFLLLKKDKLYEVLLEGEMTRSFPNYIVPGKTFTKSIQITEAIDQLLKAFSEEKNVPQKNVVQIALIEFFKKYGYEHEIDALFGS